MIISHIVWLTTAAVLLVSSQHIPPGTKLKKLCSTDLSNAYVLACLGAEPNGEVFGKRSLMPLPVLNAITMYDDEDSLASWPEWPWLDSNRHSLVPHRPRFGKRMNSGGLADECCLKPCYIEELLSYCP